MPMELSESEPIVATMLEVAADTGHDRRLGGLDSWYDGATLTTLAQIPSIGYGPPGFDPDGATVAHTIDEFVPVDGLISCAQGIAIAAMRFCGLA
jgi:acetylornithine deacetylase/succinyl-diaminopimelate desuccinylase-like protein